MMKIVSRGRRDATASGASGGITMSSDVALAVHLFGVEDRPRLAAHGGRPLQDEVGIGRRHPFLQIHGVAEILSLRDGDRVARARHPREREPGVEVGMKGEGIDRRSAPPAHRRQWRPAALWTRRDHHRESQAEVVPRPSCTTCCSSMATSTVSPGPDVGHGGGEHVGPLLLDRLAFIPCCFAAS